MIIYFILAAAFLILGIVAVYISLMELDKRISQLGEVMESRYGKWLERAASENKKLIASRAKAKPEASKTGIIIPPLRTRNN